MRGRRDMERILQARNCQLTVTEGCEERVYPKAFQRHAGCDGSV